MIDSLESRHLMPVAEDADTCFTSSWLRTWGVSLGIDGSEWLDTGTVTRLLKLKGLEKQDRAAVLHSVADSKRARPKPDPV